MVISHTQLSDSALLAIIEEYVIRDGTDHTSVERRIEIVRRLLEAGGVVLHFAGETALPTEACAGHFR